MHAVPIMRAASKTALGVAVALCAMGQPKAQNLFPPASGLLVLDLAGSPIISAYTPYTASFVASSSLSTVTFVFRHDPGFFGFDDASVADAATPNVNLLLNPGFEIGAPTSSGGGATDWTYFQQDGITWLGFEAASNTDGLASHTGGYFWDDGATGGYDGIDQTFATTVGDSYDIGFYLAEINTNDVIPPGDLYQQTCTNSLLDTECNGIDVLVYAGNGLPPTSDVTEPPTLAVFGLGLCGLGYVSRRRRIASLAPA